LTNRWYTKLLHYIVRYAVVVLFVYVGLVYLTHGMFKIVPTEFIPTQDRGYVIVNLQMPDASSIERTDAVMTQLSNLPLKARGNFGRVRGFRIFHLSRSNSTVRHNRRLGAANGQPHILPNRFS
jgi:multidrug efflux pump subunit AcrB